MIYIFNVIIALLCLIPILCFKTHLINYFKNHALIFFIKLLFISMFIYFFIYNFSISNYKIFIISGYINFTFFHILEGIVSQKLITKNDYK